MNVLEKILEEMKKIKDGNRKEKLYGKYPPQNKRQETLNAYSQGYEDGTDNFYNAIIPIIRSHINGAPDMDNGWIPVSEKLPEVGKIVKVTVHSSEWIVDYDSAWVPKEEKTYYPEEYNVYDGYIDRVGMWRFYDEGGSVNDCDKEFGINKEIMYDVVTAWMPKEQIEPYKEK
jgi:hypothetical protein|nr:MAG TPA: Protein of unknown function (DUF551) [Caudoviricetes sp.]